MDKRFSFLAMAAVLACFSLGFSKEVITFQAVIQDKVFNGDRDGDVRSVFFFKQSGEDLVLVPGLRPFNPTDPTEEYDYKVESVLFDLANVTAAGGNNVRVTISLNNTARGEMYQFDEEGARKTTIAFPAVIKKAPSYIAISCGDVLLGQTPSPVIDSTNFFNTKITEGNKIIDITTGIEQTGVIWRYAQMNMEPDTSEHIQTPDNEALPIAAWRREPPQTRGTYWVQVIFEGNENYLACTTKAIVFRISDNFVSVKNNSVKQRPLAFAGLVNGEINLSLKAEFYTVEIYNLQGRLLARTGLSAKDGINATGLRITDLSKGMLILNVKQGGVSVLQHKIMVK